MDLDIKTLLTRKDRSFSRRNPAQASEIETLKQRVRHVLPEPYLQLLRFSNGGEGPLRVQPYTFVCFDIAEVVELNDDPHYAKWLRDFTVIGGDGAGELIALDYRKSRSCPVVAIDMVNSNLNETLPIAPDFEAFLQYVGIESPELNGPQA